MKFDRAHTPRGFQVAYFRDYLGASCSLQLSSLATEEAIWLGVNNPDPQIMASDALRLGRPDLTKGATVGWVPWPLPSEVQCTTRMELTRDQVREMLPILQRFADRGDLFDEEAP